MVKIDDLFNLASRQSHANSVSITTTQIKVLAATQRLHFCTHPCVSKWG